jgi:putative salt-induced outer membrane protein YdiY
MIKKCNLVGFVLAVLVMPSRAADTNQTAALAFLAMIANSDNPPLLSVAVATNKPAWEGSVSAGFSLTKGNSDTLLTTGSFKARRRTPKNEFMLSVSGAYGESDSVKNNEFLQGASQYNHLFSNRFYAFLNAEGAHDGIADLQYRFALSPGAGYYFVKATNTTFAGEFGPGLITQRLGGVDTTYGSLRLAERFEFKLNNGARVWQRAEIVPQADKFDNFLVNAEIGAEALFTKAISLRISLLDNFVNEPAPGRKDNDVKLISGVVYRF